MLSVEGSILRERKQRDIDQKGIEDQRDVDQRFMALALEEALLAQEKGEVPVGALIVEGDKVIARAHNLRESTYDPTAHAEIIALRRASESLKSWRLHNCSLYVTLEPCVMCSGAIVQARLSRIIYATVDSKGGGVESLWSLCSDPRLNHQVCTQSGVMEEEAVHLLTQFFHERRKANKANKVKKNH